jgi:hypothetical protein
MISSSLPVLGIAISQKSQISSLSRFEGNLPLIVVACAGNELVVVQVKIEKYV